RDAEARAAPRRRLATSERELQRIVLDMHDGPVQDIFAALSQLQVLERALAADPATQQRSRQAVRLLERALGEIRNFIGAFRPPGFERRALGEIVEGLAVQHETLTDQGIELDLPTDLGDCALPTKIAIYRILQEALANGHRHSGASRQRLTVDGTEVLQLVQQHKPDVVVLDLELTSIKGTAVIAALRDRPSAPKVLVLTAYNDGDSLRSALDAGADGLALKTESPQQTLTAIRQVHGGRLVFPQAARRWIEGRATGAPGDLTPREREVWSLVAAGLTNPQIAERLGLSDNTVKFHVQHLFSKLGGKNRTGSAPKYGHGPPRQGS